ncbi:hypothetical protein BDV06DRAFT_230783 [Aspergillus oleicola]
MSIEPKENAPQSLKEFWDKTIIYFEERTGQKLDGVSRSLNDLQKTLNEHYKAQQDSEDVSKAKAIGFQMIHCIQLLGGIAAQGASMAFSPAGLCFNALSFLLDIPKKIHEFHGEIDAIFAEVGPALAQFRIYQRMEENTQLDEALRMTITGVMTCFVDLCANCMVIHNDGRWKSFKRSAKRVLLDDGSVKDELDKFKNLTQNQLNIQATLTLEVALETNQYVSFIKTTTIEIDATTKVIRTEVSGLVEGERKRTLDDARKKYLSTIKSTLGLKDEQITTVTDARDRMWKSSMKDSGKWLNDVDKYKEWIDRDSTAEPFLVLTGDPGTGKSYLVSAIAKQIKSSNSAIKAERNLVGYYSFSIAGKSDSDRQRPETAIKSICVQLAEQGHVYAKHVAGACSEPGKDEKYFRDANCQDLWTTLGIGSPVKNTTHYIFLDAVTESTLQATELDRLVEAIQQDPLANPEDGKSSRVRVLVSVEPSMLKQSKLSSTSTKCIDITHYNHDDIQAFIVEELKKSDLFQGNDEDSQRRKKMAEERLMKRSNNCYITVQQDLSKIREIIASGGTEDELNRVLQDSSSDPTDLVRSDLETLEAVLKPREIEEINELLIWAVAGSGAFELEEMAAALFLRFNNVSLQPLAQKITGKYSKIFALAYEDEYMILKDYIEDCVVAKRDGPRQSPDDPRITATISITNGNVKSVQRFFWDLNHYSFFKEFAFQPGSDLPDTVTRKIQLYKVDAHLEIVKRAFSFFLMPVKDDRGKPLGRYLMGYITDHLRALYEATGPDKLQPAEKEYIASHIYGMFNEEDMIEKNWEFRDWVTWYKSDEEMEIFWNWLDDPVAVGRLGVRDKRWLAEMKENKNRNQSLLTPIMTAVARNWLKESKWGPWEAYNWVNGFLTLANNDTNEEIETVQDDKQTSIDSNSTAGMVTRAEKWCKEALKVGQVDHIWCTCLAQTYVGMGETDAAVKQYEQAAIILKAQDPTNKDLLRDVYQALGKSSSNRDVALEFYKQAYQQDEGNVNTLYALLTRYVSSGKEDEALPIIQKAVTEKTPGTDSALFISILKTAVVNEAEEDVLAIFKALSSLVSVSPEYWAVFQHELEAAIEKARTADKYDELAIFLLQLGSAMHHLRKEFPDDLDKTEGLWHECLAIVRDKISSGNQEELVFVGEQALDRLSMFYFERAIHAGGAELEDNVEKLQEACEDDRLSSSVKYLLASFYTLNGQREKARDLLRSEMVVAFNILFDADISNDWAGFLALRHLLNHTGDYENSRKACLIVPEWRFDREVLDMLVAEEPSLGTAGTQLVNFYDQEFPHDDMKQSTFDKIIEEAQRLSAAAELGSEEAAACSRVCKILNEINSSFDVQILCDNCRRSWDYETTFHTCKYCYNVDLCDICWKTLRSNETGKVLACSKLHDWWEMKPWTKDSYARAYKKLILVKAEDGTDKLISSSKWLGILCEEWGLSKADWNFE